MKRFQHSVRKVSPAVYLAVVLFSMSTWMDVAGVWIEMPLFVTTLPEGWNLPSYIAGIIQLSNIVAAPVAFAFQRGTKTKSNERYRCTRGLEAEVVLSLVIITTETLNVFLLSFSWQITGVIAGRTRSVVMLSQMVVTALTSCMTPFVFLPYMDRFPSSYLSAHFVGQALSGLIPGLIGLIQGAGDPPNCVWNNMQVINDTLQNVVDFYGMVNATTNMIIQSPKPLFSVRVFFFCLTVLFLIPLAAFCCLNFTKCGRSAMAVADVISDERCHSADEPAASGIYETSGTNVESPEHSVHQLSQSVHANNETAELSEGKNEPSKSHCHKLLMKPDDDAGALKSCQQAPSVEMNNVVFIWHLIVIGIVNALLNGFLPSTESYTYLPYGYRVYSMAVCLSFVAMSLAPLSLIFLQRASVKALSVATLIGMGIATFHLILALQSPNPVLRDHLLGDIIVVSSLLFLLRVYCHLFHVLVI